MLRNKTVVLGLLLAVVIASVAIAGCSQGRRARSGESLIGEVEKAQKLYQRCLAYLANPVYRVDGDYSPVQTRIGEDAEVLVGRPGQLHPEVLTTLKDLETGLLTAISAKEHESAGPEEKSVAYQMLAKAYALRAHCKLNPTTEAYGKLASQRDEVEERLLALNSSADLLLHYRSLTSLETDDLVVLREEAGREQAEAKASLEDIDERLAAMALEKEKQAQEYQRCNAEARALTLESAVGSAKEGMTKLEEALRLRLEASKAQLLMAEIEYEANSLSENRKSYELNLIEAKSKAAAAEVAITGRKAIAQSNQSTAEQVQVMLRDYQEGFEESFEAMQETCVELAGAISQAADAYTLALSQLRKASEGKDKLVSIREADLLMKFADMEARALRELKANRSLAAGVPRVWAKLEEAAPPTGIDIIQSLLPDPASSVADAETKYAKAAQLYQQAIGRADRTARWIYEAQLATAHVRLYLLNGDVTALAAARDALAIALEDKEFSPNLAGISELQAILTAE